MNISPITVLIVDDSRIFRSALEECLSELDDIKVIGSVFNGEEALKFIGSKRPDVVTLDVEMPGINGLEVLKRILKNNTEHPDEPIIKVLMLSAFTKKGADITMEALEIGAYDFLTKPNSTSPQEGIKLLKNSILLKIRQIKFKKNKPLQIPEKIESIENIQIKPQPELRNHHFNSILIAVSTGGPKALMEFLPCLCAVTDVPIFIVQHMPPTFTVSLANGLNEKCSHTVIEAVNDGIAQKKHVYIAPGGRHMLIRKIGENIRTIITDTAPENGCRPSADVLFRSAPAVYGGKLVVLILTGMGNDGTKGLLPLKREGAKVIAQDEASSVVWGMPGSAVASGNVDIILPLKEIAEAISKL